MNAPNAAATASKVSAEPRGGGAPAVMVSSSSSSSTDNAVLSARHKNFMFMDQTSVVQGWRTLAAKVLAEEKQYIVCALGETNASKFNTVGFCLKRPVQILSPFAVPPGPLRRAWMNQFLEREATGQLDSMPYLLYWFDASLSEQKPHVTLEPRDKFVSYEDGQAAGYGDIPRPIQNKILRNEELTKEEQIVLDSLRLMDRAKKSEAPAFETVPDHELFDVVPSKLSQNQNQNSLMLGMNPRKKKHGTDTNYGGDGSTKMPKQGDRVAVWWDGDGKYFVGAVAKVHQEFFLIHYDDSDTEWLPLADCDFKILPEDTEKSGWLQATPAKRHKATAYHSKLQKDRFTAEGYVLPATAPRRMPDGLFARPGGRAPHGHDWSCEIGVWVPAVEGKTPSTAITVEKCKQSQKEEECVKESLSVKQGGTKGKVTPRESHNKTTENALEPQIPATTGRVDLGTKVCLRCQKGNSYKKGHDVTCRESIYYQPLKETLTAPESNGKQFARNTNKTKENKPAESSPSFDVLVGQWKAALSKGGATGARDRIIQVYNLVESTVENPLETDPAFAEKHDLQSLLSETKRLFKEHGLSSPELYVLEDLLDDGIEENADI